VSTPRPIRAARRSVLAALFLAVAAAASGCGGGEDITPASLSHLLLPAGQIRPLVLQRTFKWTDQTDFVVQGLYLPQSTLPSVAVDEIDKARFAAGAGELAFGPGGGPRVMVDVAAFDSDTGAERVREFLHAEDLREPCYGACPVTPRNHPMPGIPDSKGIHQVPNGIKPALGVSPFERYAVEFTIGRNLFVVDAIGAPGEIPEGRFDSSAKRIFEYARSQSG
jgi:hypothetical protein